MSSSNCCFLTCIWVSQEAGQVVWYSHLSQNFPQFIVIHTVKVFGIVHKAEMLDCEESWAPKNWCFWTVALEKTLESPLDCKDIHPVHSKGNQSWMFTGRTDTEAEMLILWPPGRKSWLIWKDPDAGKEWRWKEKGVTEDEMVGWHHQLSGREFEHVSRDSEGQGGLAYAVHGVSITHDSATEKKQLWKEALGTKTLLVQSVMIRNRKNTGNPEKSDPRELF